MYNIVFYEDKDGFSELNDELMKLAKKADSSKVVLLKHKKQNWASIYYSLNEIKEEYCLILANNEQKYIEIRNDNGAFQYIIDNSIVSKFVFKLLISSSNADRAYVVIDKINSLSDIVLISFESSNISVCNVLSIISFCSCIENCICLISSLETLFRFKIFISNSSDIV